jgi:hypothetical protein
MKHASLIARALVTVVLIAPLAACGGDGEGRAAADEVTEMPFDVATAGHAQGMVMFEGTPPPPDVLDMSSEPVCQEHWNGQAVREAVQVTNGHLSNVFIYVKEGLEGMAFPRLQEQVVIDQVGCRYTPHVSGVMPNQPVVFRNSDPVMHNINATPSVNRPFNFSQPMIDMENERTFAQPEVMIPVRCDVHGWMRAYVGVVPHPYFAVTAEAGTFDLSDLPPGEYVVEAWHPVLGTQEQAVTIETGQTAQVAFTFTEEMIETAVVPLGDPIDPHDHGDNPFQRRSAQNGHGGHGPAAGASGLR